MVQRKRRPLEDRFWEKVVKSDNPDDCWRWTAATSWWGYGLIGAGGAGVGNLTASRVSWELHNGPIPDGMEVCHSCDNPPCCNPLHLFLGTHAENMHDRDAKGRVVTPFVPGHHRNPCGDNHYLRLRPEARLRLQGENNPMAVLTEDDVRAIRQLWATGRFTKSELGRRFGVGAATIGSINAHRSWKHVV